MNILESIKCMKPYWEEALLPSIMEIYKDSEEVKFLSDHRDLSALKKLKEIRAKDILPHVMNLPLKEYYTEEFLEKNPNLNLQDITGFVIDCYYFEIIHYAKRCYSKGNAPNLNDLSYSNIVRKDILRENPITETIHSPSGNINTNSTETTHSKTLFSRWKESNLDSKEVKLLSNLREDLPVLKKLEDIHAKDIIEDASKVPLKEYYRELYEILDLTLQTITGDVIDCSYSDCVKGMCDTIEKYLRENPSVITAAPTALSSNEDDEDIQVIQVDEDDEDTKQSSIQVTGLSSDKDIKVTGPSSKALAKALAQRALKEASSIINEQEASAAAASESEI